MSETITQEEINFSFITDVPLRELLEKYLHEGQVANNTGLFAAVVVLCGGVLEGLLAWAVTFKEEEARKRFSSYFKNPDGSEKPISAWALTQLIKVAEGLDLIGKTSSQLLRAVQNFRNFIHPYNVLQQSARPDKRLAIISLQTVGEVVRSLRERLSKPGDAES